MRATAILVSLAALLVAILWAINKPGWDSIAATTAASAAFVSAFFLKKEEKSPQQMQKLSEKSKGYQAGRDINIK